MNFIFDNNLPPSLAKALNELTKNQWPGQHLVIHIREKFSTSTKDEEWIGSLAEDSASEWVVLTHDRFNKGIEREVLRRAGLKVFMLNKAWASERYWNKAYNLVRWWPRIVEQAEGVTGGAAFGVQWKFSGKGQFQVIKLN